jgi:nitroreductase
MENKIATTAVPIDSSIAKRWSPRAFDENKTLSEKEILALIEAARWAPSCFGEEPWRFIICDRGRDSAAWEKLFSCLTERNQLWAGSAPLLMLATSVPVFSHNGKADRWSQYDTGAASENVCLQAASMGLQAHQMGGYDVDKVRATFAIPAEVDIMAVIAVGYPGALTELHEDFRGEEEGARVRKPIGERFFAGRWGQAYSD